MVNIFDMCHDGIQQHSNSFSNPNIVLKISRLLTNVQYFIMLSRQITNRIICLAIFGGDSLTFHHHF